MAKNQSNSCNLSLPDDYQKIPTKALYFLADS